MLFISFREKKSRPKPVLLLSTAHNAGMEERVIRGKERKKPTAIYNYNAFMGGVDISDKQIYHLASERSTRRYWVKIFQNLLDVSVLNSWLLFNMFLKQSGQKPMQRDKYIRLIVRALCQVASDPQRILTPQRRPPNANAVLHQQTPLDGKKEKDCIVCSDREKDKKSSKGRKRTRYWCSECKVGCHKHCERDLVHRTDQGLVRKKKRV